MAYSGYIHLFALGEQSLKKKDLCEQKNVNKAVKNKNHGAKKKMLSTNCTKIIHYMELKMRLLLIVKQKVSFVGRTAAMVPHYLTFHIKTLDHTATSTVTILDTEVQLHH